MKKLIINDSSKYEPLMKFFQENNLKYGTDYNLYFNHDLPPRDSNLDTAPVEIVLYSKKINRLYNIMILKFCN